MLTQLRKHLTLGNVAATAALIIAMSGSSYAAVTITGAQVTDNSLKGSNFAYGTISNTKLAPSFRMSLKGATGAVGPAGFTGIQGATGPKGPTGPSGAPANVRASWSSWDPNYVDTTNPGLNFNRDNWYAWQYGGGCVSPNCHLNAANAGNATALDGADAGDPIIDLNTTAPAGGDGGNGGRVTTIWQHSTLMAWANVSLMYRAESDAGVLHTRAECWMMIDGVQAGASTMVSAGAQREIQTAFVVGNLERGPGTYNAQVRCRDADATSGHTRWQAVRANLVLTASEKV